MITVQPEDPAAIIVRPERNGSPSVNPRDIVTPFHLRGPSLG